MRGTIMPFSANNIRSFLASRITHPASGARCIWHYGTSRRKIQEAADPHVKILVGLT